MNKYSKENKQKGDITEKLREMKQRQENWMKQRDKSISSGPAQSQIKSPAHSESPRPPAAQKQKSGFHKWLKNKEDDASSILSEHSSLCSTRLNTAESDLVPPEDFDRIADQIAERVKKELSLGKSEVKAKPSQESYVPQKYEARSPSSSTLRPASHYCPQCSTLMVPPASSPMLFIPCGHTVCQRCSSVKSCSVCNNNVTSVASNIMIQQIIFDFEEITPSNNVHNYKHETREDHEEEYNSLMLRCEVLESESDDIEEKMAEISRKIGKEKSQIKMIENQETNIQRKIEELRQNLKALQQHKEEYGKNCRALDAMRQQEVMKLKMTAETASELKLKAQKILQQHGKSFQEQ